MFPLLSLKFLFQILGDSLQVSSNGTSRDTLSSQVELYYAKKEKSSCYVYFMESKYYPSNSEIGSDIEIKTVTCIPWNLGWRDAG